jgi:hypothetical protein
MSNEVIWNVWIGALHAAFANPNCKSDTQAIEWADNALAAFKQRFS